MSGAGNDFIIFDARKKNITLSASQIQKFSNRKNIGCDQLIIMRSTNDATCEMEIYNSDGSRSSTCGNATRCVASLVFEDSAQNLITIKAGNRLLECQKDGDLISVNMGKVSFLDDVELFGFNFKCADIGNPHAVSFIDEKLSDKTFFEIAPKVKSDSHFPNETNVEFAKIISDNLIEVRVYERGAGETLACGSGACAVAALAIKNSLINSKKTTIRFAGGDLIISQKDDGSIIMSGGYEKIFVGEIL